jgi:hypothetical protein
MPPHPFPRSACCTLALAAVLASTGCVSTYQIQVDASARALPATSSPASYHIRDRTAAGGEHTLRPDEIARHVRTALSAHGLYEAQNQDAADIVVEISYGVGPPRVQHRVRETLVFGRPAAVGELNGAAPEGVAREMMGYTPLVEASVTREKHMALIARQNRTGDAARPPEDLWRVQVSIENESSDLRGHLDVLASAAMDHIGRTTDGPAALTLRSDDDAVRFIRKGL